MHILGQASSKAREEKTMKSKRVFACNGKLSRVVLFLSYIYLVKLKYTQKFIVIKSAYAYILIDYADTKVS